MTIFYAVMRLLSVLFVFLAKLKTLLEVFGFPWRLSFAATLASALLIWLLQVFTKILQTIPELTGSQVLWLQNCASLASFFASEL